MSELPKGWSIVSLDAIAEWGSGGTPKRNEPSYYGGDIPWVKTGDLGPKYLKTASEFISQIGLENSSAKIFQKGSVGIAMYGATIGKTSIFDFNTATNQACAVGQPIKHVTDTEFLYYLLNNEKQKFIEKGKGGAQPNISQQIIKAHSVWLPPYNEQTRIVKKLDEVLAQVDTIKARLDGIPAILKRFRQSVLAAAVSGRLTNSIGVEVTVEEVAELVTKGASPTWQGIEYVQDDSQTLFVTSENVGKLKLLLEKKKYLQNEFNEKQKRSILKVNDVLTNIVGASIGRAALWTLNIKANINQAVCVIRLKQDKCIPKYLVYFLNSPNGVSQLLDNKVDVARANVSLKNINELKFFLPSIKEQKEIVCLVDQYFAFADTIEAQVKKAQARVDNLTQSILAKAFRGELVAQDPNDEPAEKLLERIVQARKEAEALAKAAKKVAKTK